MPIYQLGEELDVPVEASEVKSAAAPSENSENPMGCSQGMCGGMTQAVKAATSALGPIGSPIAASIMGPLSRDTSAEGQSQFRAYQQYNGEIAQQNAERQGIIDQFVKDAIGGKVTPEQLRLGDATKREYAALKAKHGPDLDHMTLSQLVEKYPSDVQAMISSLGNVFPGLKGKSVEQIWAAIPAAFKSMTLSDLMAVIPDSSWASQPGLVAGGSALASPMVIGAVAILGIGAIAFAMRKRT